MPLIIGCHYFALIFTPFSPPFRRCHYFDIDFRRRCFTPSCRCRFHFRYFSFDYFIDFISPFISAAILPLFRHAISAFAIDFHISLR
jgi:hypothetical protein